LLYHHEEEKAGYLDYHVKNRQLFDSFDLWIVWGMIGFHLHPYLL